MRAALLLLLTLPLAACAQPKPTPPAVAQPSAPTPPDKPRTETPPPPPAPAPAPQAKELFPGVRVNTAARAVEFDATIPINAHDPEKPRIYLEVIACPPDTKEHESLLLTRAKPSHIHAALLLIGVEPGTPGVWDWSGEQLVATPPTGPRLTITCTYTLNNQQHTVSPADWVLNARNRETLVQSATNHWVFAGSQIYKRQGQDYYRADADGTLIGLHTFGGETIAWTQMFNPDSQVEEPQWIANRATLPPYNTPVVVRITAPE
jgi:hypothetical protein